MILDSDITILEKSEKTLQIYRDLDAAVRYGLSHIKEEFRHDTVSFFLSYEKNLNHNIRITPFIKVFVGEKNQKIENIKLDLPCIYKQILVRFEKEGEDINNWTLNFVNIWK